MKTHDAQDDIAADIEGHAIGVVTEDEDNSGNNPSEDSFGEDSDSPTAGTPGHPGVDQGTD